MKKPIITTALIISAIIFFKMTDPIVQPSSQYMKDIKGEKMSKPDPVLLEAPDMHLSKNDIWWLNSGAKVHIENNLIKTIQGELSEEDSWRIKYFEYNPAETDNGYHPQNIFRLVTRALYTQPEQSMYFKINNYILSEDTHRSASNGVLFFNHYIDGDNLYYIGVRVDGAAVIKKKTNGIYYTMAYKPIYPGNKYDRISNPNLLPTGTWIGIKSQIVNIDEDTVELKLFMDKVGSNQWELILEAVDDGKRYGGKSITDTGYAGIRSDFMDAEFRDYKVLEIVGD